jgi:hypothetical protein
MTPLGQSLAGAKQRGGPKFESGNPYNNTPPNKDAFGNERVVKDRLAPKPGQASNNPYDSGATKNVTPLGQSLYGARQRGGPKFSPKAEAAEPMEGLPGKVKIGDKLTDVGPFPVARKAAADYQKSSGIGEASPKAYEPINSDRGKAIADAYENMKHKPNDPKVAAAYDALIKETKGQWDAIKKTGLKVDFKGGDEYPYANPREAVEDIKKNNHLSVFPSEAGEGGASDMPTNHPLAGPSGVKIGDRDLSNNDLFRVVHDYFGHAKEGNGFRGDGEFNAYRIHKAMYSPEAQKALATETLGQNAWVNHGPNAAENAGATGAKTVYAPQKAGLMPDKIIKMADKDPGATVNIGLHSAGGPVDPETALAALKAHPNMDVQSHYVQQSATEPTMVARLSRPLSNDEASTLSGKLGQEAIAQKTAAGGDLHGPGADAWKPFSDKDFIEHDAASAPARTHLTAEENAQLRSDTSQRLVDKFTNGTPAALAGAAKRGWYKDAARAIGSVFGPDSTRFTGLLAAMSPQTDVATNFANAVKVFTKWDAAGRPQDPAVISKLISDNVPRREGVEGEKNVLGAWLNNSVHSLTSATPEKLELSGPKVDSFYHNLHDSATEVTNDAHMAAFAKIDPATMAGSRNASGPGKSPTYMAMSAKVRQAAGLLSKLTGETWTPAEVQETVWSWAKTAKEHANETGDMTIPELVKHGKLTDELIRSTADFHNLFGTPGNAESFAGSPYAQAAKRLADEPSTTAQRPYNAEATAAAAKALQPHLENAARRLESVRQEQLAAKKVKPAAAPAAPPSFYGAAARAKAKAKLKTPNEDEVPF